MLVFIELKISRNFYICVSHHKNRVLFIMRDRHELQKRLFRVELAVEFALGNVQYVVVETEAVLVHKVVRALVPEEVLFLRDDVLFGSNGDHLEDK
jgi:hypothetical protein